MKPRIKIKLRLVAPAERPLARLSHAEKLAQAKAYLIGRGKYILQPGAPKPAWGIPQAGAKLK